MDKKLKDLWNKKKMALKYLKYELAKELDKEILKEIENEIC